MAKTSKKRPTQGRSARPKTEARQRHNAGSGSGIPDTDMFFPRLRRQAKWVFVLLAAAFALGFVGFGVGSGSSGIGDLLRGGSLFGGSSNGSSSSASSKKARKEIAARPKDPQGYRDLATALENDSRADDAIAPLVRYTELKPADQDALRELAGLYLRRADQFRSTGQSAQFGGQSASASQLFAPPATSKLGQALGTDPIDAAVAAQANLKANDAYAKAQTAFTSAIASYKKIVATNPLDPTLQFELAQSAEAAGDTATAVIAYKAFIKLAPDDPTTPQVKLRLKQLQRGTTRPTG